MSMGTRAQPDDSSSAQDDPKASNQPGGSSPSASSSGTATTGRAGGARAMSDGKLRRSGATPKGPVSWASAASARATSLAKTVTQSKDRHAGTTPAVDTMPTVPFTPTIPFSAAGTRPEPAVSVPSATSTWPRATATAEPLLLPPAMRRGSTAQRTAPYGLRVPTRPVANWSRLVLPTHSAPASTRARTAGASDAGR